MAFHAGSHADRYTCLHFCVRQDETSSGSEFVICFVLLGPAWDIFQPVNFGCLISSCDLVDFAGETYQQTDVDFLESERDTYRDDGSTASTAVLVGNHLYVANVGDSRTVISKSGKGITHIIF